MGELQISIIIATKNRPDELAGCIQSIGEQIVAPAEVIIVDDGDVSDAVIDQFEQELAARTVLIHTESEGPPGLSVARNTGIKRASGDVIVVLDDDAEIGSSYLKRVAWWYREIDDPDFVGVAGYDNRQRDPSALEMVFRRFFYLGIGAWNINDIGMQSYAGDIKDPVKSDWMPGYNFSYRREVILNHPFPQYNGGRESLEDIAVGWELKQAGKYSIIDPELPVEHNESDKDDSGFEIGIKNGRNRVRYFRTYGNNSKWPLFIWGMLGAVLLQFATPFVNQRFYFHWTKMIGIVVGVTLQTLSKGYKVLY